MLPKIAVNKAPCVCSSMFLTLLVVFFYNKAFIEADEICFISQTPDYTLSFSYFTVIFFFLLLFINSANLL